VTQIRTAVKFDDPWGRGKAHAHVGGIVLNEASGYHLASEDGFTDKRGETMTTTLVILGLRLLAFISGPMYWMAPSQTIMCFSLRPEVLLTQSLKS
jgi:hypothetical protein